MRDGIHKTLPLGRTWKSLLKSCEREKERAATAESKAQRAVFHELGSELSAKFLQELLTRSRRGATLLPGFACIDVDLTSRDLGGNNSPLENNVLSSAKRIEARGIRGQAIIHEALHESIENLRQRRFLQIQQHCISNAGTRAKPVINAARDALSAMDAYSIAGQVIQGKKPRAPRIKREIDPDENLKKVQ